MHIILVLWMVLIAAIASAYEIRDINGVVHNTSNNNVIIVFGSLHCPPFDRIISDTIAPIARDYPDVQVMALMPCDLPTPDQVFAWRERVPGASNVIVAEVWIGELVNQLWADVGYKYPTTILIDKSGACQTNWTAYQWPREKIEVPLTRQLNNLSIRRETNGPVVSWRQTMIPWKLQRSQGKSMTTYRLVYP